MVDERITTQAGHGWNLPTVSTARVEVTGLQRRAIDGGLGQAITRPPGLRLWARVLELAGADATGGGPLGFAVGPMAAGFVGHLAERK